MAETCKVLGQCLTNASTWTSLYQVPTSTQATVSCITICHTGNSRGKVHIGVIPNAGATVTPVPGQYVYTYIEVMPLETVIITPGFTLGAGDRLSVLAVETAANLINCHAYGVEIT